MTVYPSACRKGRRRPQLTTLGPRGPPPETARLWQDTPRPVLSGRRAWMVPSHVRPRPAPTPCPRKGLPSPTSVSTPSPPHCVVGPEITVLATCSSCD